MPDVGTTEIGNSAAHAPVSRHVLDRMPEWSIVLRRLADPAKAQTRDTDGGQATRDMKEQPINRIIVFGNFFDHDDMPGQVRQERRAAKHGKRHQIEGDGRLAIPKARFETWLKARTVTLQPCQRAPDRSIATIAPQIDRHRRMNAFADAGAIQGAEQYAGIRVAKVLLVIGGSLQQLQGVQRDTACTVAAPNEPDGSERGIVCAFDKRSQPLRVGPRKVAIAGEALLMKLQRKIREFHPRKRLDPDRVGLRKRRRRSADGNADGHFLTVARFGHRLKATIARLSPSPLPHTGQTMTTANSPTQLASRPWFFCGIGGSGMLPLALILRGLGARVAGSDRSRDQGRTPDKFAWLERLGFELFPQDGSGLRSHEQVLVASAAIEDTVPEVGKAKELGCERMSRAQLLSTLFNVAPSRIAIGGTSGKSTVTGMIGWILTSAGRDPTIMNGAVMKNFASDDVPFASARVGNGSAFVAEVDESDGSIALYRPTIAVLNNVSLDHKSLEELRELFSAFLARAEIAIVNADDPESLALLPGARQSISFGLASNADISVNLITIKESATGISAEVIDRRNRQTHALALQVPGRHNLANALAALAAATAAGVELEDAVRHLGGFAGLARRFDIVGTSPSGITVIDDFGHNPEKVAATLATLKAHPGRVIAFFQPHGYGPLRQMGHELAEVLATRLGTDDVSLLCDPVYFGGTVDRSVGSGRIVAMIREHGGTAEHIAERDACGDRLVDLARPGDRIVIMGARDDTLAQFARAVLERLP